MALAPADPVPPPVSGLGGSPVPAPRAPERRKGASGCGLLPRARIYSRGLKQPSEYTLTSRSNSSSSLGLQEKTKSLQRKNSRAGSRRARKAWSGAKQGAPGPRQLAGRAAPRAAAAAKGTRRSAENALPVVPRMWLEQISRERKRTFSFRVPHWHRPPLPKFYHKCD